MLESQMYPLPPQTVGLSVSEIVELAKAGVAVELAGKVEINRLVPPSADVFGPPSRDISQGIRERYLQSQRAKHTRNHFFDAPIELVPDLCAFQHDGKVYVFAYSGNSPPEIIVDDAAIYPSDALLARIHLMMQHGK
jgi:hypothetical protein